MLKVIILKGIMTNPRICTCICHQDGLQLSHIMPCCGLTYEKYIDIQGNVDIVRFTELLDEKQNPDIHKGN